MDGHNWLRKTQGIAVNNSVENQTIALAGLFLSTGLVQTIANTGKFDEHNMRVALESLFTLDATTVESVYGSKANLKSGNRRLVDQLSGTGRSPDLQITHYTLNLLKLESKCQASPETMDRIRRGIESATLLRNHYDTMDDEVVSLLAKIYTDNISTLTPRIVVHGNREYLEKDSHANSIRACLLAGVRAAVLWRQCGGSRWKIVSSRQKYVNQANEDLRGV